jgi:hypothetical protein
MPKCFQTSEAQFKILRGSSVGGVAIAQNKKIRPKPEFFQLRTFRLRIADCEFRIGMPKIRDPQSAIQNYRPVG